jgi:iron complex transport system substrate-binding protein
MMRLAFVGAGVALIAALAYQAVLVPTTADFTPTRLDALVSAPPRRVASLTGEADEMILGLIGPERMACRTYLATIPDYSNVAELASRVPHAVVHIADIEPIVFLDPDLVVVNDFNKPEVVYLMQQAGLKVHRVRYPRTLDDVKSNLVHLGRALGTESKALEWIREIEETIVEIRRRTQGRKRVATLVVSGALWGEGSETLVNDLIVAAGGENVIRGASRTLSPEEVLFLNPEVVLLSETGLNLFNNDPALKSLPARRISAPWRDVQPPSQFVIGSLRRWGTWLHPGVFGDWK